VAGRLPFLFRTALALLLLAVPAAAAADSWAMPRQRVYNSGTGQVRLIVTPNRALARHYFKKAAERRPGGHAAARLERRDDHGRWRVRWHGRLRNEVMPVTAMVADSGRYFVTFDDWGGIGTGPNVVVVYDGSGRVIRALSILDLLPEPYVRTLPRSFSSIYWSGEHSFSADGETLRLSLALPGESIFPGGYFAHSVTLATGEPGARSGAEWDRAMAASVAWRAEQRDKEAAYIAFMTEPLAAPRSSDRAAWDAYLLEAFKRVAPDWQMNNPWKMLVRPPGAPPYPGAFSPDPKTIFALRNLPLVMAVASPEGVALAPALAPFLEGRRQGWLRGIRVYVVADDAAWPGLVRLFAPSEASLIQLDPSEPIPQRLERLPPK
jgi:hypothetical protein